MSADDGIYILKTRKGIGHEYRVSHLQAVENVDWDQNKWNEDTKRIGNYTDDDDVRIINAREMWNECQVFTDEAEAFKEAQKIYDEWVEQCGFVEYGICTITVDREF